MARRKMTEKNIRKLTALAPPAKLAGWLLNYVAGKLQLRIGPPATPELAMAGGKK